MSKIKWIFIAMTLALALLACSHDETDPLGPGDGGTDSPGDTIRSLRGTWARDTVLKNIFSDSTTADYVVIGNLILNAKVTLEPGVVIAVKQNGSIEVSTTGSISAVGLDTNRIIIRGEQNVAGYWKGIEINSNSTSNRLSRVRVSNGGSDGFTGARHKANITLEGSGRLAMDHSVSSLSGDAGLILLGGSSVLTSDSNVFVGNLGAPVKARLRHFGYFDSMSTYSTNGKNYIDNHYEGYNSDVTATLTLQSLDVPYEIEGVDQDISGAVVILPGARFLAVQDAGWTVKAGASVKAVGNDSAKIDFRGHEDIEGYWKGFKFVSNSTANELTYVVIANGGSKSFDGNLEKKANVQVESGRLKMTHTEIRKSGAFGVYLLNEAASLPEFSQNTFKANADAPLKVMMGHFKFLDSLSDYMGNGKAYIDHNFLGYANKVEGTNPWQALNVPYRLVGQDQDIDGAVTVAPGTRFVAAQDMGLVVNLSGSFKAVGTAEKKITFVGEGGNASWKGLRFLSNSTSNQLEHVEISGAGSKGFDGANRKAGIEVGASGRLTISNSTIKNSGGVGIRNQGGTLVQSGLVFEGNAAENFFPVL